MNIKNFFKNKTVRTILALIAVPFFGLILLGLTFIFDSLFQSILRRLLGLFLPLGPEPEMNLHWLPPLQHLSFAVVIVLISWLVLRLKIKTIFKAIFLTVPLAVIFATAGIFLYRWPVAVYSLGGLILVGIMYYLYRNKQPWIYYYAAILVATVLAIFTLTGGEI
jgi:hypothetical protein